MRTIPTDLHRSADRDSLNAFLQACQDEAIEDNHFKVVSISLATGYLDSLAVLSAIYEPTAWHFYAEHPQRGESIAGAETVVLGEWQGVERFAKMREFAEEVLEHTISIGDVEAVFSGPHFFCGFGFQAEPDADDPFPAATLFLPQWQVASVDQQYTAIANCLVDKDSDLESIVNRIWAARKKFAAFAFDEQPEEVALEIQQRQEVGPAQGYKELVKRALEEIKKGSFKKIVMARAMDLKFSGPCQPLMTLHKLKRRFGNCFIFSFQNGSGDSFIGATPERLLQVRGKRLQTEAIAGSVRRGKTPMEDAALARELLSSDKDLREHQFVIDSIQRRLAKSGVKAEPVGPPRLLDLVNVRHLHTPLQAEIPEGAHILDYAAHLHPTPAVGGIPREQAMKAIRGWEPFSRSLYTGLIGWFNARGEGEFAVNLRSAWIKNDRARIFAGAGIVAGSDPEKEFEETQTKMNALLEALAADSSNLDLKE